MRALPALRLSIRRALLPLLLVVATTSACARLQPGEEAEPRAVIVFVNQSLDQADVYVVASTSETIRIGTVMAGGTESLTLPTSVTNAGPVDIVARLLARRYSPRSGPVSLSSGQRVQVTLPMDQRTLNVLPAEQ